VSCFLRFDGEKRGALCRHSAALARNVVFVNSNVAYSWSSFQSEILYYNVSIESYGVSIPIARKYPF